jgi:hypothetical protein
MQVAAFEPRLLQRSRPLPFCPRPFPGEAVESWIWRIGREFGYTQSRFLRAIGCPSSDRKDPALRLTQADIPYLATLARLSPHDLAGMAIIPPDWRLRAIFDVPFCGPCWIESQRLQGFAYLQGAWMHAGRISCPHHGKWLFSVRDKLGRPHCDPAHRAHYGVPIPGLQDVLDHQAHMASCSGHRWISDAGDRLKAFEAAVVAATAGYSPPTEQWGLLSARDFLNIVHDVTTWSLTNFESFKAPCPATVYYHDWAPFLPPIFLFVTSYLRAWAPEHPERPMRLCVNPDERRNALWITMALLGADHPAMPGTSCPLDRLTRQRQTFNGQNPAGLSWLVSRMRHWPEAYRDACWVAWEELLLPPRAGRSAAVS